LAEHGVFLVDRRGNAVHLPAHPVAHAHDVGAGDSFAAALALSLAAGSDVQEAVQIGIDAASIAVTKRWTAVVQQQELLQRVSLREYAHHARLLTSLHTVDTPSSFIQLAARLDAERNAGRRIVLTNGVFDILHAGHVQFLRQAKALGDVLVVGINSDSSTRRLKGPGRPINSERDRMALVAALDAVDYVALFDEDTPTELIRLLHPHIHVKGGDYANEALPEAAAVQEVGGRVVIVPLAGTLSTSSVIDRIVKEATHLASSSPVVSKDGNA
jgi:D-beta-D-heptose 7-phosphate kinase / D-beta-D-heptose 1-phosphate adenosyltransferase